MPDSPKQSLTSPSPAASSSSSSSNLRLSQISTQIAPMAATAFDASVVPQAPEDALFGLMAAYRRDTDSNKVDLGIGAYRDNNAKPWVLPVVKKVGALAVATDSCLLIIYDRPTRSCVRIPTSTTSTCPLPVCQISQQRPKSSSSVVTAPLSRKSECVALPTMT